MRKSGEKLEGIRDADRRPQTVAVHKSSRGQVLRFSASLIHRCRSFVGSINRPSDFESRLAYIVKHRHGHRQPGPVHRWVTRLRAASLNFLLVAALQPFRQMAPFIGRCEDANIADLPSRCGAQPDQRRRLTTGPKQSSSTLNRRRKT